VFLTVASTPYDHQMAPVWVFLNADIPAKPEVTSLTDLNDWMRRLRAMPYRYSKAWKTPTELNSDRMGDCKGKAVALYEKLLVNGAHNVRLVIGKHRTTALRTHAWVEWETAQGTLLLDPTLNWTVTKAECQDESTYIPLYAYENGRKYRALNSALIARHNSLSDQVASRE
jgi:predicted transglutaminase-like cysteine proteinase